MSLQAQWDDPASYEDAYPPDWDDRRTAVYERDGYACQECGRGNLELHAHHINPLSQGGTNHLENLVTLCVDCHDAVHGHPTGSHAADAAATPAGYDRLAARPDTANVIGKPVKTLDTRDALRFTVEFWRQCRPAQFALVGMVLLIAIALTAAGTVIGPFGLAVSISVVIPLTTIIVVLATYDYLGGDAVQPRTLGPLFGLAVGRYVPTALVLLVTIATTSLFGVFMYVPGFWVAGRLSLALPSVVLEHGSLKTYLKRSTLTVRDTGAKRPVYGLVATSIAVCFTIVGVLFVLPLLAPAYTLLYLEYRPEYFIDYRTGQTF